MRIFFGVLVLAGGLGALLAYNNAAKEPRPPVYQLSAASHPQAAPAGEPRHWPKRALDRVNAVKVQAATRVETEETN